MQPLILPTEQMDDLGRGGLRILQKPDGFRFGMDAILLSDFVRLRPRERVADLGTGTGILPLLMSQNEPTATFEAVELLPDMADMARRSVELNGLETRIHVHAADMRTVHETLGREKMDVVVCNPPYFKRGAALPSESEGKLTARHESATTIEEVGRAMSTLLRNHGCGYLVFPSARFLELCDVLRAVRLEPKQVRMVCAKASRAPYLVLLEVMKNARPALLWHPPLVVYDEQGNETRELKRIYHMEES